MNPKWPALVAAAVFLAGPGPAWPLDLEPSTARKIRYPEYDAEGRLKFEALGDQAAVQTDGRIQIVNLKIIIYEEGQVAMEVTTPVCLLDRARQVAVSTGAVCVTRAGMVLTGQGYEFSWTNKLVHLRLHDRTRVVLPGREQP